MVRSVFVSDIHLSAGDAAVARCFFRFLDTLEADSLYILGDLFDAWAGDDDLGDPFVAQAVSALGRVSDSGISLHIMAGNRDFLAGERFYAACGAEPLPDPVVRRIQGWQVLLTHGDALCTSDLEYQAFRREVRDPAWQRAFLSRPLGARKALIAELRAKSEREKQEKSLAIMDVDEAAVAGLVTGRECDFLIHGHTHRPGRHRIGATACERWVLGDWHAGGAVGLSLSPEGPELLEFE